MRRGEGAFDSGELADAVARSRRCQIYYSRLFYEDFTVDMISIQRVEVWKVQLSTDAIVSKDFHLLLCLMTTIIRYNKFYRGFGVMGSFCPLGYVNYVCNF